MSEQKIGIKCGDFVNFSGRKHLFLGFIDSKRCIVADNNGNKIELWIWQLEKTIA